MIKYSELEKLSSYEFISGEIDLIQDILNSYGAYKVKIDFVRNCIDETVLDFIDMDIPLIFKVEGYEPETNGITVTGSNVFNICKDENYNNKIDHFFFDLDHKVIVLPRSTNLVDRIKWRFK